MLARLTGPVVTVRTLVLAGLALLGIAGGVLVAWSLLHVVLLVLTAVVLGEGLRPAVERPCRRGMPYPVAIAVVYLALVAVSLSVMTLLMRPIAEQAGAVMAALPDYESSGRSNIGHVLAALHVDSQAASQAGGTLVGEGSRLAVTVVEMSGGLVGTISDTLMVVVLSVAWLAV
jgi:predicted PurR-regulated permease PerM